MQVMTGASEYAAFMYHMRDVINNAKVIQALFKLSEEEWDRSRNMNTDEHLIKGVFSNGKKSDAIRIYIAKLVKLHMLSTGNRLTTWTKDTIASENPTNMAITSRINATELRDNTELFMLVAGRLIGYDDELIRFALMAPENSADKALYLMKYMSARFDLTVEGLEAHATYIDQTDRLEELFAENGFDDAFFFGHAQEAIPFFKANGMTSVNHWDLFEGLDPIVSTNLSHAFNHGVLSVIIDKDDPDPVGTLSAIREVLDEHQDTIKDVVPGDCASLRGCTKCSVTLDEKGTPEDLQITPVVGVLLDKGDPDPLSTIKAAREAFFEAHPGFLANLRQAFFDDHPKYLEAIGEPCLTMPELVDALRKAADEGTQVDAINLRKLLPGARRGEKDMPDEMQKAISAVPVIDPAYLG